MAAQKKSYWITHIARGALQFDAARLYLRERLPCRSEKILSRIYRMQWSCS